MIDALFNIGFKSFFAFIGLGVVVLIIILLLSLVFGSLSLIPSPSKLSEDDKKGIRFFIGLVISYFLLENDLLPASLIIVMFGLYLSYEYQWYKRGNLIILFNILKESLKKSLRLIVISIGIFAALVLVFIVLGGIAALLAK